MVLEEAGWVGHDLQRPECVLCTPDGDVWTSDWNGPGGVVRIRPDGVQRRLPASLDPADPPLRPNGIALLADGSWLVADLSDERGGVWRLRASGMVEPFLLEVDGRALPPTNFVHLDGKGRVWITISTRLQPRASDYRPDAHSGFIVMVDDAGARIVADGLGYANECRLDAGEQFLYVSETFARRITRFRVAEDGSLHDSQVVAAFGPGTFPDGLALDEEGGIWVVSIVSNRVIRVAPDGIQETVLEDADELHVNWVEAAFQSRRMDRAHLDSVRSRALRNISSIAFGGPDLKTVYLGCLLGERIATFRSPIAGLPPVQWRYRFTAALPDTSGGRVDRPPE